jgi:hypothetical protein
MAVAGKDFSKIISFKNDLTHEFDLTDLGEIHYILGLLVTQDRVNRHIYLNQTGYIETILKRFGMAESTPVNIPLATNHNLSLEQCPKNAEELEAYQKYLKGINYLSMVGSLLYATQTRPDIQYAVGIVAQYAANPGITHLATCKRILHYLKGTKDFSLMLGTLNHGGIRLVGWSDANWAGDSDDRKSVSGYSFDVDGGTVSWSSKKQRVVATSTVEAEYIASSNATKEAIWLCTLLSELDYPQSTTIIHTDSAGNIALSHNPVAHSRAKHIDIRYHFIRDRIERKEVELKYVTTKSMVADIFTKALPRDSFTRLREVLGVIDTSVLSSGSVEKCAESTEIDDVKE